MSARRGPYRRHARLRVQDTAWKQGDAFNIGRTRWLIYHLAADGAVVLHSSSTVNHLVVWTTTLDRLPERTTT
ncbi:hypothetical protein [Microbacterium sp.]|uniref:hypothetical protein n=1 Tax=Microbacterium sp. TaxID=51671 RepID=UPI0037C92BDC